MSFKFKAQSEEEIKASENKYPVWPAGEYDAEIIEAGVHTAASGNQSIKLNVKVFNAEGHSTRIFDYLSEAYARKLKHACAFAGLDYTAEEIDPEYFIGKTGTVVLKIDPAKGQYVEKNSIADYVSDSDTPAAKHIDLDDDLPF